MSEPTRRKALLALLAAIAAFGVTIVVTDSNDDGKPDTITIHIDNADRDRAPDNAVTVPTAAVAQAKPTLESRLRAVPPEAPQAQVDAALEQQNDIRRNQEPLPTAGASQGFAGCATRFVRNQSNRGGVRPQQQWLHYTVSPNRPGWSDVNAIVALFNRPSFQASSHFVIDREGHCAYIVPIEAKAWTQAAANPVAVSYEIINSGRESSFMDSAGYAKLSSVIRQVARRTGIPTRRGAVSGCRSARKGIVQHKDGGLCAGGHVDITPYSVDQVTRIVAAAKGKRPLLRGEEARIARGSCRAEGTGLSRAHWRGRARRQANAIRAAARRQGGYRSAKSKRLRRAERYQVLARRSVGKGC